MKEVKVSVVIPVYNTGRFLGECLDSVCNQTLREIEIICVDDGSTDNSAAILEEYRKRDDRFVVLKKEHVDNAGAGTARNMGIDRASGKYLAILDSDDFFEPDMLEKTYKLAEQEQAQLIIHTLYGLQYDNQTKKETKKKYSGFLPEKSVFSGLDESERLFQIINAGVWHVLFLREFVKEKEIRFLTEGVFGADDIPFNYIAMAQAERIAVLNSGFVHHRSNTGTNQSATGINTMKSMFNTCARLKEVLEERNLFDIYRCTFLNGVVPRLLCILLESQQDFEKFSEWYKLLKGEISRKLGLPEYLDLPPDRVYNPVAHYEYKRIMELSCMEYLSGVICSYPLPKEIQNVTTRIILYGGGIYGRMAGGRIYEKQICQITGWVDQKYEELGFPFQSPDSIRDGIYDYIFITIIDEKIVQEVEQALLDMGVARQAILTLKKVM